MLSYTNYLQEKLIKASEEPNTLTLYHGGNLDTIHDALKFKKGRWEYGAGLYLTTHYDTAKKYSKGNRKLYQIVISKGKDANTVDLDVAKVKTFIDSNVTKNKKLIVMNAVDKFTNVNKIKAYILINIIVNNEALKLSKLNEFRVFLVANGVDYLEVNSAFGWGETMIVLFNLDKIVSKYQIKPTDKFKEYDMPTKFVKIERS